MIMNLVHITVKTSTKFLNICMQSAISQASSQVKQKINQSTKLNSFYKVSEEVNFLCYNLLPPCAIRTELDPCLPYQGLPHLNCADNINMSLYPCQVKGSLAVIICHRRICCRHFNRSQLISDAIHLENLKQP